jgi:hypothetical protein
MYLQWPTWATQVLYILKQYSGLGVVNFLQILVMVETLV